MNPIEQLLRREIGLDAASVGSTAIERTVRLRMKHHGLKSIEAYRQLLETSHLSPDLPGRAEWEELVEAVVVTETWFFRDRDAFTALIDMMTRQWLTKRPGVRVRILSLPCSSGEEPYSLAMALNDAAIPRERFTIDAVDISMRALARAQRGVYSRNSFRGSDLDFRERHFEPTPGGYILHPHLRDCVNFQRANIVAEDFLADSAPYDFIFCRNLLIYFDHDTRTKALERLRNLLSAQGLLFVGPAELPLATAQRFVSANLPMAFACRRDDAPQPPPASRTNARRLPQRTAPSTATPKTAPAVPAVPPTDTQIVTPSFPSLSDAQQFADAGRLDEAVAICNTHLDRHGPSAQAFYLLGLVRDASGDPEAMDYYRKALYLEPDHYETLLHMSLLMEKNGDPAGACTFKRRAERVQPTRAKT